MEKEAQDGDEVKRLECEVLDMTRCSLTLRALSYEVIFVYMLSAVHVPSLFASTHVTVSVTAYSEPTFVSTASLHGGH